MRNCLREQRPSNSRIVTKRDKEREREERYLFAAAISVLYPRNNPSNRSTRNAIFSSAPSSIRAIRCRCTEKRDPTCLVSAQVFLLSSSFLVFNYLCNRERDIMQFTISIPLLFLIKERCWRIRASILFSFTPRSRWRWFTKTILRGISSSWSFQ